MKTFIKKFVSGFMNCVKSDDPILISVFWFMSVFVWAMCGIAEKRLFTGEWMPFGNPEWCQSDMWICIDAVTIFIVGVLNEWVIVFIANDEI